MKKQKAKKAANKKGKDDAAPSAEDPTTEASPAEPTTDAAAAAEPTTDAAAAAESTADENAEVSAPEAKPAPAAVAGLKAEAIGEETIDVTSPSVQASLRNAAAKASGFPFTTPEGEVATAADIYRKQVARIEDLEKENKRLARESADAEKRWQKAEGELADLREADGDAKADPAAGTKVEKLVCSPAPLLASSRVAPLTPGGSYVASRDCLPAAPKHAIAVGGITPRPWLIAVYLLGLFA